MWLATSGQAAGGPGNLPCPLPLLPGAFAGGQTGNGLSQLCFSFLQDLKCNFRKGNARKSLFKFVPEEQDAASSPTRCWHSDPTSSGTPAPSLVETCAMAQKEHIPFPWKHTGVSGNMFVSASKDKADDRNHLKCPINTKHCWRQSTHGSSAWRYVKENVSLCSWNSGSPVLALLLIPQCSP